MLDDSGTLLEGSFVYLSINTKEIITDLVEEVKELRCLEKASEDLEVMLEKCLELKKENKRFREALEFYSNEKHYEYPYPHGTIKDFSEIARKALEGK